MSHVSDLKVGPSPESADMAKVEFIGYYSAAVDPASIAADAVADIAVTLTGVKVGDAVMLIPPSDLEADLMPHAPRVTAADTVKFYLENESVGAVDGASKTWGFLVFRRV